MQYLKYLKVVGCTTERRRLPSSKMGKATDGRELVDDQDFIVKHNAVSDICGLSRWKDQVGSLK